MAFHLSELFAGILGREDARAPLFAQFFGRDVELIMVNHEAHQRFGLMRVEVIENNNMGVVRMEIHHRLHMPSQVRFGAGRLNQRRFNLPRDDVTGGN